MSVARLAARYLPGSALGAAAGVARLGLYWLVPLAELRVPGPELADPLAEIDLGREREQLALLGQVRDALHHVLVAGCDLLVGDELDLRLAPDPGELVHEHGEVL